MSVDQEVEWPGRLSISTIMGFGTDDWLEKRLGFSYAHILTTPISLSAEEFPDGDHRFPGPRL
jgi:hypothetical protein